MREVWIAGPIALAVASPAFASPAAEAFALGRFAEAMAAGAGERTAAGRLAAGRAASTLAAFRTADRARARALLLEAEAHFDAALAAAPPDRALVASIRLQKAIAEGYRAKLDNSPGAARSVRRTFEALVAERPDDALALAALGGWHGEAVATLGRLVAGTALGAREGEALRWFDRALAAPAADPVVPVFTALTLLNLSAGHAPRARALLERAGRAPAADGFEALVKANGAAVLALLAAGDTAGARRAAQQRSPLGSVA